MSGDRWTCPTCLETVVGGSRHRRVQRRIHGRRHGKLDDAALTADRRDDRRLAIPDEPPLVIPRAPKGARRGPRPRR